MDKRCGWQSDYPMSRCSSWRAGGAVRWLFTPATINELTEFLSDQESANDCLFVGHGSNLLVRDGGYDGIIVRTAPGLSTLRLDEDGTIFAAAGVSCPRLARFSVAHNFCGGEFFSGIPGTVGGALAMNAGCYGDETWTTVESVSVTCYGKLQQCSPTDFNIAYRRVETPPNTHFLAARFRFPSGDAAVARQKIKELLRRRRESQPLAAASAGSVFCNPPGDFAARLIESCGLKGMRVGAAEVSTKHANFIINTGAASAADIENLIEHVKTRVAEQSGVCLREEVRIIGKAA